MTENKIDILNATVESKQQLAYCQLKNDIINNVYPVGTMLVERKLCEIYNVSRSPIRNAIQQLTHEGLLAMGPGKSVTVADFNIEDILEVYDLMELHELYAIRSISSKIDQYFLEFLNASLDKMAYHIKEGDLEKATKWDRQFHQFLISSSSNKRLITIYQQLEIQSLRFIATTTNDVELAKRSYQEHMDIYLNLKERKFEDAQTCLQKHYQNTKQYYIDKLISRIQI